MLTFIRKYILVFCGVCNR